MQISISLALLGLHAAEGQEIRSLQEGLSRLCPTGVNLPGLPDRHARTLDRIREGAPVSDRDAARAAHSLVDCLSACGFLTETTPGEAPGVRLFRDPSVPLDLLSFPSFGGVDVATSEGPIRFGGTMWSNKDVLRVVSRDGRAPDVFVLVPMEGQPGFLGFEFLRNNVFVTSNVPTFVVADEAEAHALDVFLRRTYESTEHEAIGAFASPDHRTLRRIVFFDASGRAEIGGVVLQRTGKTVFRIVDRGRSLGTLDLSVYASRSLKSPLSPGRPGRRAEAVRRGAVELKKPGLWPIGTASGFATDEETSGFMVWNDGRFLLVDPPSSTPEYLRAHHIPLDLLDGIVVTHGHTDHCTDALPRLLKERPKTRLYTTRKIFEDLSRQLDLAMGKGGKGFRHRHVTEIRSKARVTINGLQFRFHETLHTLPSLGFEIWNGDRLALHFSGDTFADPSIFEQFLPGREPYMSRERAFEILRHYFLIPRYASQEVPPVFLIEAGIPPIHTSPELTRSLLEFLRKQIGVDVSNVYVYHISNEKARRAKLPKWAAGHEGWIDLSAHYQ